MSQNTAITVTGLKKSYKNLKVLEGISFSVQQGSIFALLGPNEQARPRNVSEAVWIAIFWCVGIWIFFRVAAMRVYNRRIK
jgi:hypothetical protein